MKNKKSLQKFTDIEKKVNDLLKKEKLTLKDIAKCSKEKYDLFMDTINDKINNLKGIEKDKFLTTIDVILTKGTKNKIWESNHISISATISNLIQENRRMPSKTEIAQETGLSRTTVHKHLKEYANNPFYLQHIEKHKFMASTLLSKVYLYAANGDMSAAKLYFKMLGYSDNGQLIGNTFNQNNFIQINNTVLNQDTVKHLNVEQLNAIEDIVKAAASVKEVVEVGKDKEVKE